jgi:hypothetical protein
MFLFPNARLLNCHSVVIVHGGSISTFRFDTVTGAQVFRREGARLAKAEHAEFSSLFFSNSVTQSTRVRIEVLKTLAKKLTTPTESAFVQGFISRPVLQYHVKEGCASTAEGVGRSYNYVDAIAKFFSIVTHLDLSTAYTRAGVTFAGSMSQYFIVLSDEYVTAPRTGANRAPIGRRGGPRGRGDRGRGERSRFGRGSRHSPASRSDLMSSGTSLDVDRGLKRPSSTPHSEEPSNKQENILNVVE